MWYTSSSRLRVDDYELLMKSGWRRRGMHVRKPLNSITCCPAHPVWCDAMQFEVSGAHKKVVYILGNYLRTGKVPKKVQFESSDPKEEAKLKEPGKDEGQPQCQTPKQTEADKESGWDAKTKDASEQAAESVLPDICERAPQLKAKRNKIRELEYYMKRVETREGDAHTLDVRVCSCSPLSPEISATLNDEYAVFDKYLSLVHGWSQGSISFEEFQEIYVETPLMGIDDKEVEAAGAPKFGTYHQQYWLDGNKLIAVGVVDLLPGCLSSVYFFNDPSYLRFNLGTFSALWELAYVRNLQRTYGGTVPAYANLQYYTMGYYIHSSSMMNYKAECRPPFFFDCLAESTTVKVAATRLKATKKELETDWLSVSCPTG
ncbi:unnamed protein product [Taenia asiatica]|uniref:Arginyl-tRNA--protein transferase 1 n=1 Tax=Taenia asiatica TaxID=60517 RepID=A0A0R3WEM5_TAEAS|nr:unnamed protein product [Taenia asiatica]